MKSEDFAAWLSAISGMSGGQREEAMAALERAAAAAKSGATKTGRPSRREDGLGTGGVERVAAQGCPHCAGREIVGWGRSDGLLRYRCKSCRRTFNALTKTPMAHLRKKEKWLDHARAMIEGKSLAKTAALCGVHPTTAFRWRHRFLRAPSVNKPRTLRGIVEADETFILESFKGQRSDLPRTARKRGGKARHPGPYQDSIPVLVARDRRGSTFDAVLPQVTSTAIGAALAGIVTPVNHLVGDGGLPIAGFARRAGIPFHAVPSPGKPAPEAPHLHINNVNAYHSRLKQWLSRFNGVATKNLPTYLGWRRALEAWGDKLEPPNWINGAIGNGPYQQLTL
jgi:transposase-like protein